VSARSDRQHPRGGHSEPLLHLYSPTEIAKALGCSEWWVKEQARGRRIPFAWIGGSYRFTGEHLAEIIRIYEMRPTTGGQVEIEATSSPRPRVARTAEPAVRLKARQPKRAQRSRLSATGEN